LGASTTVVSAIERLAAKNERTARTAASAELRSARTSSPAKRRRLRAPCGGTRLRELSGKSGVSGSAGLNPRYPVDMRQRK
jgi:hypothetical protein